MKSILSSLTILLFVLNLTNGQNLLFDQAHKLDVNNVVPSNVYGNENLLFFVNHDNALENVEESITPDGIQISSVVILDGGTLGSIANLLSNNDTRMLGFNENVETEHTIIPFIGRDTVLLFDTDGADQFTFPSDKEVVGIIHFSDRFGFDSLWSSYMITPENTIQHFHTVGEDMLLTGSFRDSMTYVNPDGSEVILKNDAEYNGYVINIDPDGYYSWSYLSPSVGLNFIRSITDYNNEIYIAHDKVVESSFIQIDIDGNEIFKKDLPNINLYEIKFDQNNEAMYMSGHYGLFGMEVDAGLTNPYFLPSAQEIDAFLVQYDLDKNANWQQRISGDNIDTGVHFDIDNNGNVIMTGCIQRDGIFDPDNSSTTLQASGFEDIFVAKYNSTGDFLWAENFGGTSSDIGTHVFINNDEFTVFGIFRNQMDVDPSEDDFFLISENDEIEASYFITRYIDFSNSYKDVTYNKTYAFPNPAQQKINVAKGSITALFSANGRLISTFDFVKEIDVENLDSGVYFLEVLTDNKKEYQKIIVQH